MLEFFSSIFHYLPFENHKPVGYRTLRSATFETYRSDFLQCKRSQVAVSVPLSGRWKKVVAIAASNSLYEIH